MTANDIDDTLDRLSRPDAAEWLESREGLPAMLELAKAHDNLRAEVDRLKQRAVTAELALMSMTARVSRDAAADVFTFDGDLDDAGYFCAVGI